MIWNEILCIGDSITYGARDEYGRTFPNELASMMTDITGEVYFCHNFGISGETSSDLLRRVWGACKFSPTSKIMTLLIGTNDTQKDIPIKVYEDNLKQIINAAKIHGKHIFMLTLPKLGFTPLYYKNSSKISDYNKVIYSLAEKMNCHLVDLDGVEKFYIDGVHFKNEGHVEIARRVKEKILNSQT